MLLDLNMLPLLIQVCQVAYNPWAVLLQSSNLMQVIAITHHTKEKAFNQRSVDLRNTYGYFNRPATKNTILSSFIGPP